MGTMVIRQVGWTACFFFGKVIEGMVTVYVIEEGSGTYYGKPRKKVIIGNSREIPKSKWEDESQTSGSYIAAQYILKY